MRQCTCCLHQTTSLRMSCWLDQTRALCLQSSANVKFPHSTQVSQGLVSHICTHLTPLLDNLELCTKPGFCMETAALADAAVQCEFPNLFVKALVALDTVAKINGCIAIQVLNTLRAFPALCDAPILQGIVRLVLQDHCAPLEEENVAVSISNDTMRLMLEN